MIKVTFLKLAVSFWKRSLSISEKLSSRTWVALALLNAMIAIPSFWAYRAQTVPTSAIPPVDYRAYAQSGNSLNADVWRSISPEFSQSAYAFKTTPTVSHFAWVNDAAVGRRFNVRLRGANFNSGYSVRFVSRSMQMGDWFRRLPKANSVTVEVPSPQAPSLLDTISKEVALVASIITTILAIMNGFFAWMVYKRGKAQDMLLQLQIAKLNAELAQLRAREAEAQQESQTLSLIVLS